MPTPNLFSQARARRCFRLLAFTLLFALANPISGFADDARPNIVIVMADDLGFSDVGCYGGEIDTPHLDSLAAAGVRFRQFYNTGRCCPTRAALLTGLHQHQAGIGHMTGNNNRPAYQGYLNHNCATIAEVLRPHGYATLMTGKWHVGSARGQWPLDRGFDSFFGCPTGGGFYFHDTATRKKRPLVLGNDIVEFPPDGYVTDLFTDHALNFIDASVKSSKPFFLYLAHIAPHWPLQAKPADIEKYKGRYEAGWEAIRQARWKKQIETGLLPGNTQLSPAPKQVKRWADLKPEQRADLSHRMAVYAAQVDAIDQNIGKLVEKLKEHDQFENTLILFLSDNGCSAEGGPGGFRRADLQAPIGTDASYASAGLEWANVSDTPFRKFKTFTYEGGIASPLIAHWPAAIKQPGKITSRVSHVTDLMPTCLEVAGATYPEQLNDHDLKPLVGQSLTDAFDEPTATGGGESDRTLFWSHEGNRAVRSGKWKLVADNRKQWELYDLEADRSELTDLAKAHPERATRLAKQYDAWADEVGVEPWPLRKQNARAQRNRPNIVLIMADDVGVEAFGCYGSKQYQTPNLDRLAEQGMRFTACHSQPLCTPSRVKLLTGRSNVHNYAAFSILPRQTLGPQNPSLGERLQQLGYRTFIAGKWQLLGAEHYSERFRGKGSLPQDAGFDRSCLWQVDQLGSRYWNPLLSIDGNNKSFPQEEYGPDVCTRLISEFIKEESRKPFFVYYPMILVHSPFKPTPHTTRSPNEQTRQTNFEDMVSYMDHLVGQIGKQLERAGQADNTLFIFTSDNGTHRAITSQWKGRPYPGGKGLTTDAGTHVPLIVRWPGKVAAGSTCDDLIDFTDFYPTLVSAAKRRSNAAQPTAAQPAAAKQRQRQAEGISFLPQLKGREGSPREWAFCYYNPRPERTRPVRFVRSKDHKLYGDGRLFDIGADPKELNPLDTEKLTEAQSEVYKLLRGALESYPSEGQKLLQM